mgnify:CR=1 FL=1
MPINLDYRIDCRAHRNHSLRLLSARVETQTTPITHSTAAEPPFCRKSSANAANRSDLGYQRPPNLV